MSIPLHGKFKTRKVMTCLDPKYRIMVQCQKNVNVLNVYKELLPKLGNIEMLANEHDERETGNDVLEELLQVETKKTVLNDCTSQFAP